MPVQCKQVIEVMDRLAPQRLARDWDNVGLLVGDPAARVERVLVVLTVTPEAVAEAGRQGAELIISHHPLWLKPLRQVRLDSPTGRLLGQLLGAGIAVFAAHTNLDAAPGGVNACLAAALGLEEWRVLETWEYEPLYKLVVFVPQGYEDTVRQALGEAGAGHTGQYAGCTFQSPGTGTFLPLAGARPFIGRIGELEKAAESRLETIVPASRLAAAVDKMLAVHPYEEVAYDVYRLQNRGREYGLGGVGRLAAETSLAALAGRVEQALASQVRVYGDPGRRIEKVAFCGGAGGDLAAAARAAGAQVLITGDVTYHQVLEAGGLDLAVVDAGHAATEIPVLQPLAEYLREQLPELSVQVLLPERGSHTGPGEISWVQQTKSGGICQEQEKCESRSAETSTVKMVLHVDGAARGNPGPAGIGVVIQDSEGHEIACISDYLGETTNNVAEYRALIRGLEEALDRGATAVEVFTDSQLLARQVNGTYRVKHPGLQPLFRQVIALRGRFRQFTITSVPRERNKQADRLANEGVDGGKVSDHGREPGKGNTGDAAGHGTVQRGDIFDSRRGH
ncbi:MAG: Nif3-like dinuclear metal center hexameric protein [Clostridia bacterium]|nr:MAG: Nif3-like dinuclear metal center hexameric protein [Clostridia bacterium]